MFLSLFADASSAPVVNWDAIPWHGIFHGLAVLVILFLVVAIAVFVVLWLTKGKAGVAAAVNTIEADAAKVMASPVGADLKALAKEAASAALAELKQAPTPAVSNHPFVADAIALAKHAESAAAALAQAQAATKEQVATIAAAAPPAK